MNSKNVPDSGARRHEPLRSWLSIRISSVTVAVNNRRTDVSQTISSLRTRWQIHCAALHTAAPQRLHAVRRSSFAAIASPFQSKRSASIADADLRRIKAFRRSHRGRSSKWVVDANTNCAKPCHVQEFCAALSNSYQFLAQLSILFDVKLLPLAP